MYKVAVIYNDGTAFEFKAEWVKFLSENVIQYGDYSETNKEIYVPLFNVKRVEEKYYE